jgi:hypothetical protein
MMCALVWVWDCVSTLQHEFVLKGENTRMYMYRQTDRHRGWISEIVAAHTLAHEVHTHTPLRCD